MEYHPI